LEGWVKGKGFTWEGSYVVSGEKGLQDFLLDDAVLERIVIGLRTINGTLLAVRTALLITFCCWKNLRKLIESVVPDDELGNVARAELVNDTEAGGKKAHWGGGATRES
jgi:hypothetical protein